jgi:hypothetical protein
MRGGDDGSPHELCTRLKAATLARSELDPEAMKMIHSSSRKAQNLQSGKGFHPNSNDNEVKPQAEHQDELASQIDHTKIMIDLWHTIK